MTTVSPIIVALDYPDEASAIQMADRLDPDLCRVKVGKELFTIAGPKVVESLQSKGFDVFLDLKFHDIPNTTSKAVAAAANLGVWMVNVHASGGRRMMEACRDVLESTPGHKPLLIGVTVLTSMSVNDLSDIGVSNSPEQHVLMLAQLAQQSGLDGVVCSAQESRLLNDTLGSDFSLVTPGIRLPTSEADDQRRVMTPVDAISAGSDYLVIGRPITQASNPVGVLQNIVSDLEKIS